MYNCSECGRTIGAFDEHNPPVCPYRGRKRVAKPTVLAQRSTEPAVFGGPVGASMSFVSED